MNLTRRMFSKVEEEFEYKGYTCLIIAQSMGYRCGYVIIPTSHEYHMVHYNDIDADIMVYGGLTYSNMGVSNVYPDEWVLGFDCGHWGDGKDIDIIRELASPRMVEHALESQGMFGFGEPAKTKKYVRSEIMHLVDQLEGCC